MAESKYFTFKICKAVFAEFLGTAFLVIVGLASCLNWTHPAENDTQYNKCGFGFPLMWIFYIFGPISGAHVNPAITIAFLLLNKIPVFTGTMYIIFQFLGAIAGAGVLYPTTYGYENATAFGLTTVNKDLSVEQGLIIETVATFIFILAYLVLTDSIRADHNSLGLIAIGIGLTLTTLELGFVSATGASLNPARSFGPALIVCYFDQLWVYMCGPIFGAVIAGILYRFFTYEPIKDANEASSTVA